MLSEENQNKPAIKSQIILGIDPGTVIMGYGLIKATGQNLEMLQYGVIHLSKYEDYTAKLKRIFERCLQLIDQYQPSAVALEAPFYAKNVQSMLKLGRAQGTAMAAALYRDKDVFEYAPRKIKQSITGNGNASKEQVALMLQKLLNLKGETEHLDATDALGVAVCHFFQQKSAGISGGKGGTWKAFLQENPKKVLKT